MMPRACQKCERWFAPVAPDRLFCPSCARNWCQRCGGKLYRIDWYDERTYPSGNQRHCPPCSRERARDMSRERGRRYRTRHRRRLPTASCACCGGPFRPERTTGRYCSPRCRVAAHRARKK
jgi:hypothetical protein